MSDPATPELIELVDASEYQTDPNFVQMKAAGVDAGIFRATIGTRVDDHGILFRGNARAAGLDTGIYGVLVEGVDFQRQFDTFCKCVDPSGDTITPSLDLERGPRIQLDFACKWVEGILSRFGIRPIVYTGDWFREPTGGGNPASSPLGECPLWLSAFVPMIELARFVPKAWADWAIQQYTDQGKIPGCPSSIDRSRFRGTIQDLRNLGRQLPPPQAQQPQTGATPLRADPGTDDAGDAGSSNQA